MSSAAADHASRFGNRDTGNAGAPEQATEAEAITERRTHRELPLLEHGDGGVEPERFPRSA
jgi:hypothetical protein